MADVIILTKSITNRKQRIINQTELHPPWRLATSPPWGTPMEERMPHVEIIRKVRWERERERERADHENDDDDDDFFGLPTYDITWGRKWIKERQKMENYSILRVVMVFLPSFFLIGLWSLPAVPAYPIPSPLFNALYKHIMYDVATDTPPGSKGISRPLRATLYESPALWSVNFCRMVW